MAISFLICASITALSAFIGFAFSISETISSQDKARTTAMYLLVRSAVLFTASIVPFFYHSTLLLIAVALCMILVQALDAIIGVIVRDRMRLIGPLVVVALNSLALFWFLK